MTFHATDRARRVRAVLLIALLSCAIAPGASAADRPDILLITMDTTRADRLGFYGYERPTSPNLDAFAEKSVVYERAFSTSTWTLPAHASLFTGLFPTSHGARFDADGPLVLSAAMQGPANLDKFRANPLSDEVRTPAEILSEARYATAGIVGGPWLKRIFGFDRGFAHYDDENIDSVRGRIAESVTDSAIEWLGERGEGPFFLFLNYYDPHGPYSDPAGHARAFLPPNTRVFPYPKAPSVERISGKHARGTPKISSSSSLESPWWMSYSEVREALLGSVANTAPSVRPYSNHASMVQAPSSPRSAAARAPGTASRIQAILAAEKYGSSGRPVSSRTRAV